MSIKCAVHAANYNVQLIVLMISLLLLQIHTIFQYGRFPSNVAMGLPAEVGQLHSQISVGLVQEGVSNDNSVRQNTKLI